MRDDLRKGVEGAILVSVCKTTLQTTSLKTPPHPNYQNKHHTKRSRWAPKLQRGAPRKKAAHTALSDIKESLAELRYYKERLFRGVK
jgi:hypothetical protein